MKTESDIPKAGRRAVERAVECATFFSDLRRRNERRIRLATVLEGHRRQQVTRVMDVARQRRFRQGG